MSKPKQIVTRTGGCRALSPQLSVPVSWNELTAMTEPSSEALESILRRKALSLLGPERGADVLSELEQGRMPALVVRAKS